jgi:hypothetical protein
MGIPMTESCSSNAKCGDHNGWAPRHAKSHPKKNNRSEDAMLNESLMNPTEAETQGSTKHHGGNERAGEKPEGAPANLNSPEAHGDHHKKMVQAGQRMKEASLSRSAQIHGVKLCGVG